MPEVTQIYTEKQRISKIKKEKKRLEETFKNMETTKLKLVEKLIDEAAFQSVTLEETREIIKKDGVVEEYQIRRESRRVRPLRYMTKWLIPIRKSSSNYVISYLTG